MAKIAVIGTGRMGSALAQAFLSGGHEMSVWNRTPQRARPLVEHGAKLAGNVLEAVSGSALVVSILSDYKASDLQLHAAQVAAALRGKTLVQLASGSPSEARAAAAWAREHGVHYLDGAIMATPELIGKPESTILYAGEHALFAQHEPLLGLLAGTTAHVGDDHGHAAALDSALLVYMWGALFGALHGVAISRAEGISLERYLTFTQGLLPVTNAFTVDLIERATKQHYDDTQATLDTHYGALQHVLEICQQRGLDRTIPEAFERVMRRGRERDLGGLDFSALIQSMK